MFKSASFLVTLIFSYVGVAVAAGTMTDSVTGMQFVQVPAGCFDLGEMSSADKAVAQKPKAAVQELIVHDGPGAEFVHENAAIDEEFEDGSIAANEEAMGSGAVCLKKSFWMGKYEVTQGQFKQIMGDNPSGFKKGDSYPVERVGWFDAQAFIRQLNKATGKNYRLPSEAEWEYAARSGGRDQKYGAGNSAGKSAWYMANSRYTSHPVGGKQANVLGLHDMSGNVWEWTADCWNESLATAPSDGSANTQGNCTARVLRGGSWYDAKSLISTTARLWNDADKFDNNSGFRLVHD
ncbi:MAG: formylglycine-generating enzyme family protein [Mariprofundus sp.]